MLAQITTWLFSLVVKVFSALWDFLSDIAISILDGVLKAFAALIAAIPVPDFLSSGMQALFGGLGNDILYLLNAAGLTAALALLGAGYTFRLARKFLTLFQW